MCFFDVDKFCATQVGCESPWLFVCCVVEAPWLVLVADGIQKIKNILSGVPSLMLRDYPLGTWSALWSTLFLSHVKTILTTTFACAFVSLSRMTHW